MKVKIVSALLLLVTVFSATAANARPYFAVNPACGGVPVVSQYGGAPLICRHYGYYPQPAPYYYHRHRRWHRHW